MKKEDPVDVVNEIFESKRRASSIDTMLLIAGILAIFALSTGELDSILLFWGMIGIIVIVGYIEECSKIDNSKEKIKSIQQELVNFFQRLKSKNRISGYDYVELEKEIKKLKKGVEIEDDYTLKLTDEEAERLMCAFENLRKELQEKRLSGEL